MVIIAELPRPEGPPSGAPYLYRKENHVHAWNRNQKPMQLFFHVKMASGMDRGRVRPTTTTTTSHNMAALLSR